MILRHELDYWLSFLVMEVRRQKSTETNIKICRHTPVGLKSGLAAYDKRSFWNQHKMELNINMENTTIMTSEKYAW